MGKVYINQTLLRLILLTEADLTNTTGLEIKYIKPDSDKTEGSFVASSSDKPKGEIYYDFQSGDIDVAGIWKFWTYVTFTTGSVPGEAVEIRFYNEGE